MRSFNTPVVTTDCNEHPFVSIVVCTLGNRLTLDQCVTSLLSLQCCKCEILLVLSGGGDDRKRRLAQRFPVKLIHERRRGVSIARNTAVAEARGEIVAFVDDDVVVDSNWLHELVE